MDFKTNLLKRMTGQGVSLEINYILRNSQVLSKELDTGVGKNCGFRNKLYTKKEPS